MDSTQKRQPRQAVLAVSHADGHVEFFAESNIDFHLARFAVTNGAAGELMAEEIAIDSMPRRFRDLYRADRRRKTGSTRPLLPSVLAEAIEARESVAALNGLLRPTESKEATIWTL